MNRYSRPGNLPGGHPPGGLDLQQEEVLLFPLGQQEAGLNLLAIQSIAQDKIPVAAVGLRKDPGLSPPGSVWVNLAETLCDGQDRSWIGKPAARVTAQIETVGRLLSLAVEGVLNPLLGGQEPRPPAWLE